MQERDRPAEDYERFRELYAAMYPAVLGYALRRTATVADAYDVCAETFLVAWRRLADIPPGDRTIVWFYGVARRVLANARRSADRRSRLVVKLESQPHTEEADDDTGGADQHQEVLSALALLSPEDQEILTLAAWEGLSHAQLGEYLGCTENAATVRLFRARQRLAKAMAKGSGDSRTHTK